MEFEFKKNYVHQSHFSKTFYVKLHSLCLKHTPASTERFSKTKQVLKYNCPGEAYYYIITACDYPFELLHIHRAFSNKSIFNTI